MIVAPLTDREGNDLYRVSMVVSEREKKKTWLFPRWEGIGKPTATFALPNVTILQVEHGKGVVFLRAEIRQVGYEVHQLPSRRGPEHNRRQYCFPLAGGTKETGRRRMRTWLPQQLRANFQPSCRVGRDGNVVVPTTDLQRIQ